MGVRMVVHEALRGITRQRALVEIGFPNEAPAWEGLAIAVFNPFHISLDEAWEVCELLGQASKPTLSIAPKEHCGAEPLRSIPDQGRWQPLVASERAGQERTFKCSACSDGPPEQSGLAHPGTVDIVTGWPFRADCVAASAIANAATPSASVTGRGVPALTAATKADHSAA